MISEEELEPLCLGSTWHGSWGVAAEVQDPSEAVTVGVCNRPSFERMELKTGVEVNARMARSTTFSPLSDQQSSDNVNEGKSLHLLDYGTRILKGQTENNYNDLVDFDYGFDEGGF
ncbi:hypothetical protein V6N13_120739 [Hibiscus sabdariffa]|uniref:Uncharacterized protein n=1 Tax=Hibiscus sabdariffa TaxID=183260 RepID=A0ABR2E539_9ROSI